MHEIMAQAQQALGRDGSGRAVDGLEVVEWIGGPVEIVAQLAEARSAGVPIGNAACWRFVDIELTGRAGRLEEVGRLARG